MVCCAAQEYRETCWLASLMSSPTDGLLERDRELELLNTALACARDRTGRLLVVSGPAGVGKTALLRWVQRRAENERFLVLRGRGVELEEGFAFGVVRQLFERVVAGFKSSERSKLLSGSAHAAGALFGQAAVPGVVTEARSFALVHGLYALAANLSERRPIVIIIDDVHWADGPSLRWLSYLAGRVDDLSLLAVVAFRGGDLSDADARLGSIAAESGTRKIEVEPLTPEASSVLVTREFGDGTAPEFCAACHLATGGNPFFLGELFRALRAGRVSPTVAGAASVSQQGPATLARSVLLRTAGLSGDAAALAQALAVLGDDADLRHAASLASLDTDAAAEAATQLADARIIGGELGVSFAHPIVRSSIYTDIPSATRVRIHDRAARLLSDAGATLERIAAHLIAAAGNADPWSVQILENAAADALDSGAPESAVGYLRRALSEPAMGEARERVLAQLGWAEYLMHDRLVAVEHLTEALRITKAAEDRTTLALRASRALLVVGLDRSEDAVGILDSAIPELPHEQSQLRMRLEAQLITAAGLKLSTRPLQREWLRRVRARTLGDTHGERLLLANLVCWTIAEGHIPGVFDDLDRRAEQDGSPAQITLELTERALAGGRLLDDEGPESELFYMTVSALQSSDWLDRSAHWLDRALDLARDRGSAIGFALASAFRAEVAYRAGDLQRAEADARAAMSIAPDEVTDVLVNILIERGELGEASRNLSKSSIDSTCDQLMLQPAIAARGRLAIAQGNRREGIRDLLSAGAWLERWPIQNPSVIAWRSIVATALNPGERERAVQLASTEIEQAQALDLPCAHGIALRARAQLEHGSEGIDLLQAATAVLEASPARLEHARALTDLGAALRRNGNRAEARGPLRLGLDVARRCGASALADRARLELLATGARPRRDALTGRDALTAMELRVAGLAAAGLSTPEIAQSLFITTKTVETHLGHTYRKLDIHSRHQLARALSTSQEHGVLVQPPQATVTWPPARPRWEHPNRTTTPAHARDSGSAAPNLREAPRREERQQQGF